MQVRDILDSKGSDVVTIRGDVPLQTLVALLASRRIGAAVVMEDDEIVGIASERDVVLALSQSGREAVAIRVADLMTREVITCAPDDSIQSVMSRMTDERIRHMPVMHSGRMVGVISIGDVVKLRVGEVENEVGMLRNYIEAR